jgi:hypothetical protein
MDDLVMEIDERLDQDKIVSRDGREASGCSQLQQIGCSQFL